MSQTAQQSIPPAVSKDKAILRAEGIRKAFSMGLETSVVLRSIDLVLRAGDFVAIEGRSGSGKSTLLHILGALDEPDAGTVEYQGENLTSLSGSARSRMRNTQFGFVFQFYHLLPELNVLENTLLAPMIEHSWVNFTRRNNEFKSRAAQLLNSLGLGHRLRHKVTVLSGGERQRVAIARALMNGPELLLCDEPTGNLDTKSSQAIGELLLRLAAETNAILIAVTHSPALAAMFGRQMRMLDGALSDSVGAEEVISTKARSYEEYK
jgi:lipoprotein-releasing system ATP-binding protein